MAVQLVHVTGQSETSFQATSHKRKGSAAWHRYEKYKKAKTVVEFWELGGTEIDLKFDYSFDEEPVPLASTDCGHDTGREAQIVSGPKELPHDAPPMHPSSPKP